jgi:hypothetical protein
MMETVTKKLSTANIGTITIAHVISGEYEPPKAAKERVPSKYKSMSGTGCNQPYTYMGLGISNRRTVSKYGKFSA